MKKTVSLFFAAFFAVTLTSCEGPLQGDYRTIQLGIGAAIGKPGDTEYIERKLKKELGDAVNELKNQPPGTEVQKELEVDGSTCTVTLRTDGSGYNVGIGGVDLRNEHALKGLLRGMQEGIPGQAPIHLDFSGCPSNEIPYFMPPIIGKPEVDKTRFVEVILPDTVTDLYHAPVVGGADVRTFDGFTNLKKITAHGVTEIRANAFQGLKNLEMVNTPAANSIGANAFNGCEKLEEVNTPLATSIGVTAFYGCEKLTTLTVNNSITVINERTFVNCKSLTKLSFPNVATIGYAAFDGCINLLSTDAEPLFDPQKVTSILVGYNFRNCKSLTKLSFPKVETITNSAFDGCGSLLSTEAEPLFDPQKVTSIQGGYNFKGCKSLEVMYFPKINAVPKEAFSDCTNLKSLGNGTETDWAQVTNIGTSAFQNCRELVAVKFSAVQNISSNAFKGCEKLETVDFAALTSIGSDIFAGLEKLEAVNTPNLEYLSNAAFAGCKKLTTLTVKNTITEIPNSAFKDCESLTAISTEFPNVITIKDSAFENCSELTAVNFPSVNEIKSKAFKGCSKLGTVNIPGSGVDIAADAFSGTLVSLP